MTKYGFIYKNISKIEFVCIVLFLIVGGGMIYKASSISAELTQEAYTFEMDTRFKEAVERPFNNFLWKHDFSKNKGEISFRIIFNDSIDYILIDFPSFVKEDELSLSFFNCNNSKNHCKEESYNIEKEFINHPTNDPRYTTFVISNLPLSLEDHDVTIKYRMDIKPNGVFTIYSSNRLYNKYAIDFSIGPEYDCEGDCFIKDESIGVTPYYLSGRKDIKLRLDAEDERRWYRIKLGVVNKKNVFRKNLFNGLGISLLGSSIILLFTFFINNVKEKKIKFSFRLLIKLIKYIHKKI